MSLHCFSESVATQMLRRFLAPKILESLDVLAATRPFLLRRNACGYPRSAPHRRSSTRHCSLVRKLKGCGVDASTYSDSRFWGPEAPQHLVATDSP